MQKGNHAFRHQAKRRLRVLEAATSLQDLASLSSNHLEALGGDRKGHHAIFGRTEMVGTVLRRAAVKAWRALLRMQRATLATAVCILRNSEGQILVAPAPNGELKLPAIPIDGWLNVHAQVEEWLQERVRLPPKPTLVCVNGTPSRTGVTFLFAATVETQSVLKEELWVEPELRAAA